MLPDCVSPYCLQSNVPAPDPLSATELAAVGEAMRHLDAALRLLRPIDEDIYWDLAATACDSADNLIVRAGARLPEIEQIAKLLGPHRDSVASLRPRLEPLGPSATASRLDMVALARNLLSFPAPRSA